MPHTGIPPHMRNQRGIIGGPGGNGGIIGPGGQMQNQNQQNLPMNQQQQLQMNQQQHQLNQQQMPQQVIDHDENLSDKEVFPGNLHQQQQHGQMVRNFVLFLQFINILGITLSIMLNYVTFKRYWKYYPIVVILIET